MAGISPVGSRQQWLRPVAVVWGLTAVLAGAAAALWALELRQLPLLPTPVRLPWLLLAVGFGAGHFAGIRLESRGQSHNIDLSDIVLLPAIVFAGPGPALLAAAAGTLGRSLWIRRPAIKALFNTALHALAVGTAAACFRVVLGHGAVLGSRGWLAAAAAVLVAELVTLLGIEAVIAVSTGQLALERWRQLGTTVVPKVGIVGGLGLAAVYMLWLGWSGGVLFAALAAVAGAGYAAYGRLRSRHLQLDQLHHFERALAGLTDTAEVVATVMGEAAALFHADLVQLVRSEGGVTTGHTLAVGVLGPHPAAGSYPMAELALEAREPVVAPRGTGDPELAGALEASGFRDAVAVPLPAESSRRWALVAANRRGASHITFGANDVALAQTLAMPTAMALRGTELLGQLHAEMALVQHQASHDGLTGLANRTLFSSELDRALAGRPAQSVVGVLIVDLDGFKKLNDSLGHELGDMALQTLARRLSGAVGDDGTVGRIGGDELAVVLPGAPSPADVIAVAERIDTAVRAPAEVAGVAIALRASIGVAVAPFHGENRYTLLRQADLAMSRAKQTGGGVRVQSDRPSDRVDRPSLVAALRQAIDTSELRLAYQPTVDFATGRVNGVEALSRWTHPLYGVIGPDQFIPIAEASGLIGPLTRWMLETAVAQMARWQQAGFELTLSVNLSPEQVGDSEVVAQIGQLLRRHGLAPSALTLEVTESQALSQLQSERAHLLQPLADLGVGVSLDDFGVGTSTLVRLKSLPVNQLKIDKAFTASLTTDPTDHAIVASTITLAHTLGLEVTAEGIETAEAYQILRHLGCDSAQGYLISVPLAPADLTRWLYDFTPASLPGPPPGSTSDPRFTGRRLASGPGPTGRAQ